MSSGREGMKRRQREAVVVALDEKLAARGSWCGETHLQKAVYFLQTMLGVPTGFEYILYKFGPFSRELRAELGSMRADGFLELVPKQQPYGPTLRVTDAAQQQLVGRWPKTLRRYRPQIDFVADKLGALRVGELEELATTLWARSDNPGASADERAQRVHDVKPHVSKEQALAALCRIDEMEQQAADLVVA